LNILVTCPSTHYRWVTILRKKFSDAGFGVITAGNSNRIQGLYASDKAYVVPSIGEADYVPSLLKICLNDNVKAVLTMADEDILVLSKAAGEFQKIGVIPLIVNHETAQICDNKFDFYQFLVEHGYKVAKTFSSLEQFRVAYETKEIMFPVFIKPVIGAGSWGAMMCRNMDELLLSLAVNPPSIIQEYLDGPEFSVDVYMDIVSGKMASVFAKQKLTPVMGTIDTALSIIDERLFSLAETVAQSLGAFGPLNIDIFKVKGDYYIGEVNPRFGGSYVFADACGVDFCSLIVDNIRGLECTASIGNYQPGILMMKYDEVILRTEDELI